MVLILYRWDKHHKIEFYSEHVEIVFSAIYTSVNELGEKASLLQDRDVTKHLVEIVSPKSNLVWQSFYLFIC
jgi:acyclic sesquiterpene synthase